MYPYLRGLTIERPNQVWCADITYIPVQGGFLYLVAIMDWASRRVLAWRLSNTMDTEFCLAALAEALESYGIPEIFNTDQGSQFTSIAFTGLLETAGIRCSMDGRGRCMDNVFIERLWRSLKYEALHDLEDGFVAQRVIAQWIGFYNEQRPHSALAGRSLRKPTVTGWRNVRRRWRSEQERQATGMGYEGIRGRTGARAWEVIHIYTGSFTPSPDPTPFYRRLISTRKGGLTTNGIHLLIPASLSNRSGPPHGAEGAVDRASGDPQGGTDLPDRERIIAAPQKQLGQGVEGGFG